MPGSGMGCAENENVPRGLPLHRHHRPPVAEMAQEHPKSRGTNRTVEFVPPTVRFRSTLSPGKPELTSRRAIPTRLVVRRPQGEGPERARKSPGLPAMERKSISSYVPPVGLRRHRGQVEIMPTQSRPSSHPPGKP
ncbi:hypothetical protein PV326_011754 [Microctonus aethiopoides]|nr:hypothetical protein PV326_011754 [Microctonus aethiopoides]